MPLITCTLETFVGDESGPDLRLSRFDDYIEFEVGGVPDTFMVSHDELIEALQMLGVLTPSKEKK